MPAVSELVSGVRDPKSAKRRKPWGLLFHTTGSGITATAKKRNQRPIDVALTTYIAMQNGSEGYLWGGPAYVLDHDGTLYQIAHDDVLTHHCGSGYRAEYRSGDWVRQVSPKTVDRWILQWHGGGPYDLFPSTSPNVDYVGCEMIPVGNGFGVPARPGLLFTEAQHLAAIELARKLGKRHGWPTGWAKTSRLVGHEDVSPIERSNAGGGWDPGWLRANPYFDFAQVRQGAL